MWTLMGGKDEGGLEAIGIVADVKRESRGTHRHQHDNLSYYNDYRRG